MVRICLTVWSISQMWHWELYPIFFSYLLRWKILQLWFHFKVLKPIVTTLFKNECSDKLMSVPCHSWCITFDFWYTCSYMYICIYCFNLNWVFLHLVDKIVPVYVWILVLWIGPHVSQSGTWYFVPLLFYHCTRCMLGDRTSVSCIFIAYKLLFVWYVSCCYWLSIYVHFMLSVHWYIDAVCFCLSCVPSKYFLSFTQVFILHAKPWCGKQVSTNCVVSPTSCLCGDRWVWDVVCYIKHKELC